MPRHIRFRRPQVVIVETRQPDVSFLQFNCHRAGCDVGVAASAEVFVGLLDTVLPDLIVLDWTSEPNLSKELLPLLRQDDLLRQIPLVHFGEAEGHLRFDHDVRISADVCGDQFARECQLILQAQGARATEGFTVGGIELDLRAGTVSVAGQDLNFGATEVRLLAVLLRNPEVALNRNQLLDRVWGRASDVDARTIDVHISRIRKRLRPFRLHFQIQTARGVGYRFVPDSD